MTKKSKFKRIKSKKRYSVVKTRNISKKKRTRTNKKNLFKIQLFFSFIILILAVLIFYTFFIFPDALNKKMKKDLIEIYKPIISDDSKNILVLKVNKKPDIELQKKTFRIIQQKYGLAIKFDKIRSNDDSGINKITFYKNNNKFNDLKPIYIFWDENLIIPEEIIPESEAVVKKEYNYEKIEEKRKKEKKEELKKPDIKQFKHVTYEKSRVVIDKPKIAIVIDDVGYSYNSTYDFLSLGFPITFALIPEMKDSDKFYSLFKEYDYEMILHIPMEPLKGKQYVEKNAIYSDMPEELIKNMIKGYLKEYPDVIGANNHMGSKVMTDARAMNVILNELSLNDKLWLDSMTNINTISKEVAALHNLSYYERDVFLDNSKNITEIRKSMNELIKEAKKKGKAIGIGHIQTKELVIVLKEYYNNRYELGVEFVPLSKL